MNQQTQLEEAFNDLVSTMGFTEPEKEKLLEKLGNAITMNFTSRMLDHLKDEDKDSLVHLDFGGNEETFKFFESRISAETMKSEMGKAAEDVLERFLIKVE